MKKLLSLILSIVICLTILPSQPVSAAIKISKAKATMEIDSTLDLKISGTDSKVTWSTTKKSVATVTKSGTITAKKEGNATITATINSKKYTCKVTVVDSNKPTPTPPNGKYTEGTYKIGTDISEGEYVIFGADGELFKGYFSLSSDSNEKDIIVNDNFNYCTIIYAKQGEYLKIQGSYMIPLEEAKLGTDGEGFFKIGYHLSAGEYKLVQTGEIYGYYCIYNDNRHDDIESNDMFDNTAYITVKDGQYLELKGCKIMQ
jgi:hypothetical protein